MAKQYRIVMQPEAYEGMNRAYRYIEQNSATAAHSWAVGLMEAINSLKNFPSRCAPAPENDFFIEEIRMLLYGKGKSIYRILFTISVDTVSILHICHGAHDTLKPE